MGSADNPPTKAGTDHSSRAGESEDPAEIRALREKILRQINPTPDEAGAGAQPTANKVAELGRHFDVLKREMEALNQLGDRRSGIFQDGAGKVHDVARVINDADMHFQTLALAARNGAQGVAGQIYQAMDDREHYDARKAALQQILKTEVSPADQQQMGINFDQPLTTEQVQNAIIKRGLDKGPNLQKDPVSQHLTEYLTLSEMSNIKGQNANSADVAAKMVAAKMPALVGLAYADFLMKYKDGISVHGIGNGKALVFTAGDIVNQIAESDKKALPDSQQVEQKVMQRYIEAMHAHNIPDDKNPYITLSAAQQSNDINLLRKAARQSDDPAFDPEKTGPDYKAKKTELINLEKSLEGKQLSADDVKNLQSLRSDVNSLEGRTFVRSDAYRALGQAELKAKDPDVSQAIADLVKGVNDPRLSKDERKEELIGYLQTGHALIAGKVLGAHPELNDVVKMTENADFQKNDNDSLENLQKYYNFRKAHGQKAFTDQEMADVRKWLESAYSQSDLMQKQMGNGGPVVDKAFKELNEKKDRTPDEEREWELLGGIFEADHRHTVVAMELGYFEAMSGHIDEAKSKLEEARKDQSLFANDPKRQKTLDDYTDIVKQKQFDNAPFYSRWGTQIGTAIAGGGAFGAVAWGVGALLAPETGGLSLAAAASITGVGITAGAAGTLIGAGLEKAGGARDTYWEGVKDVAPWAMTAGGIGSGLAGFAAPVLATGGALAEGGAAAAGTETLVVGGTNAGTEILAAGGTTAGKEALAAGGTASLTSRLASKVPLLGRVIKASEAAPFFTKDLQVKWFADMAANQAHPWLAYAGANSLRFGMIGIPGAVGVYATSDHPVVDSASYLGTAMAAGPLGWLGKGMGETLPWGIRTVVDCGAPAVTTLAADAAKNAALVPFDSRGGNATLAEKTLYTTFTDAQGLALGVMFPGTAPGWAIENRENALEGAAFKHEKGEAARKRQEEEKDNK